MTIETLREAIPNLDSFVDPSEAREARDKLEAVADAFHLLARYAEAKGDAMYNRLNGKIELASQLERACDVVYGKLPEWARW